MDINNMKEANRTKHYAVAVIAAAAGVLLDQFTKYLAITRLKGEEPFILLKGVFQFEYLENRGAAFGLFQDQRMFFFISVAVICTVVIWFYLKVPMERRFLPLRICAVLIVAGAFGNCIDRVRLNYVVDFFYIKLIDFPIFNVADIYVTVSTFALVVLLFFYYKEEDFERIFHRRK
ncbi:lipoprotein signal peptidase [Lachnospiraceae bacterium]|uniref:signal peptidase II n=1 Tax=Extibacter sp. GGCC_0201 TaxID=2731209 RepID=UPI001AA0B7CB|nr:signal peptidase II [Extibacter sp. GGCC_0201]MBO1721666.1 signal peptidase II [Extibacter sp. GGCC_0201]BDF33932.1 lipoprotein signal peptidase [Lachnospiraceae bacterium]BDF37936.1 lipoprotein signal peptidase [Lachnospiraceae bacterium]